MLKRIRLKNFKSFVDETVELAPFTVLIGENASGKSNFLEAIRVLQGLGMGMTLVEILDGRTVGGIEVWRGIRGGSRGAPRAPQDEFTIESLWDRGDITIEHSVTCSVADVPHITAERLHVPPSEARMDSTEITITAQKRPDDWSLEISAAEDDAEPQMVAIVPARLSGLAQLRNQLMHTPTPGLEEIAFGAASEPLREYVDRFLRMASNARSVEINPNAVRTYGPSSAEELGSRGENLSAVLQRLCSDPRKKQEVVDWVSELAAPAIRDIDFSVTEEGRVLFRLVEEDGTKVSAFTASDGTIRFLGLVVAAMVSRPDGILMLEELETGLHPARAHLLVEKLEAEVLRLNRQIVATTHSTSLLQALSLETLQAGILVARVKGREGSVMRRLSDIPHFVETLPKAGIDYMMMTEWLERAL